MSWLLLFQTRRSRVFPSWLSTILSNADASMVLFDAKESPLKPTTKSKYGSMLVCEAGEEGVTRRTWRASGGVCAAVDCPAPIASRLDSYPGIPVVSNPVQTALSPERKGKQRDETVLR